MPPPGGDSAPAPAASASDAVDRPQLEPVADDLLDPCDLCGERGHDAASCPEDGAESPSTESPQTPPADQAGGGWWSFAGTALRSFQETGSQLAHTIAEGAASGSKALSSVTLDSLLPPEDADDDEDDGDAADDDDAAVAPPQRAPASASEAARDGSGLGKRLVSLTQQVESGLDVVEARLGAFSRKVFGDDVDAKIGNLGNTLDKHLDKLEDQLGSLGGRMFSFIGSSVGMNPGSVSVADGDLVELDEAAATYLMDPADEYSASWSAYCDSARSTISQRATGILKSNAIVRGNYTCLVPDEVSAELFWLRYTFKLELLHQRELRRQKLAQAALDVDAEAAAAAADDDFQWSDGDDDAAVVERERQQQQEATAAAAAAAATPAAGATAGAGSAAPKDPQLLQASSGNADDSDNDDLSAEAGPADGDDASSASAGDSSGGDAAAGDDKEDTGHKVSVGRASVASSDRSSWAVVDDSSSAAKAGKPRGGPRTPPSVAEGEEETAADGEGVDWDAWE